VTAKPGPGWPRRIDEAVVARACALHANGPAFARSRDPSHNSLRAPKGAALDQIRRVRNVRAKARGHESGQTQALSQRSGATSPAPALRDAMMVHHTLNTHAVPSRQAVFGGGDFAGRLKKSAWSRSA
jgi:hypothetical protein